MDASKQLEILSSVPQEQSFRKKIQEGLFADTIDILQINVGKKCNLACKHCHVEAGPDRTELMSREILEKCLEVASSYPLSTIDITGGSPEMNPHLEWFIPEAARLNRRLLVRSNLVILLEDKYKKFIDFYARHGVEVITSLPDYHSDRVERQRGSKTFMKIIEAIKLLNRKGYGEPDSGLLLDVVYNPVGTYLPGSQKALEMEYKNRLGREYGVTFNTLYCITNCPAGRFLEYLVRTENFDDYMTSLFHTFNPSAIQNLMCRTTLSVGWDGQLYDCDFNQMLSLPVNHGAPSHIRNFNYEKLNGREIVTNNHCYCCTAGAGSSCQGALE